MKPAAGKSFNYNVGSAFTLEQGVGVFLLRNSLTGVGMLNVFKNNRFRRIFARTTGIYELGAEAFEDIRFAFEGNSYHEIFAETAGIIHLEQKG